MYYFTSDSHFSLVDKKDTIERDFRPFKSVKEMNKKIIKTWNKQAGKNDIIYHLGDFANFNKFDDKTFKTTLGFVKKIKAKVVLILGNNEEYIIHYAYNDDYGAFEKLLYDLGFWKVVRTGMYLEFGGEKFYLNHYPSKHKDGVINLFGHIHSSCLVKRYGFNVGVDNNYFRLFSEDQILQLVQRIPLFDSNVYD